MAYQTFTCQAYLDNGGRFPFGPPIVVVASDKTAAVLKTTEQVRESGMEWKIVAVEPPAPTGNAAHSHRRRR